MRYFTILAILSLLLVQSSTFAQSRGSFQCWYKFTPRRIEGKPYIWLEITDLKISPKGDKSTRGCPESITISNITISSSFEYFLGDLPESLDDISSDQKIYYGINTWEANVHVTKSEKTRVCGYSVSEEIPELKKTQSIACVVK